MTTPNTTTDKQGDWNAIENNWSDYRSKVKQKWNRLSEDDLEASEGNREHLAASLQKAYGTPREQIDRDLNDFACDCNERDSKGSTSPDKSSTDKSPSGQHR